MIKKFLLTLFVIFLMYLLIRWRKQRAARVETAGEQNSSSRSIVVTLAASLVVLMAAALGWWFGQS